MYRKRRQSSNKPPKSACAVIYARVSSQEQAEGYSIDAQLGLLRGYALAKGFEVAAEFVESETAKTSGRPEFGRMVDVIRKGAASVVVVEKTDRLYRNLKDRVTIDELGAEIHLVKEATILSPESRSHEKFVHDIKVVIAKNYIDNLSEEVKKGMSEKARQGLYPSFAPLGYENAIENGVRIIRPDPARAPQIARMFEAYAAGEISLKQMSAYSKLLGLKTRKGNDVHTSTIQYLLQNPVYAGEVEWEGKRYPGSHVAIVSPDLFRRAQEVMNRRKASEGGKTRRFHTYAGLITCGACGCACSPIVAKGQYTYYSCSGAKGCRRQGVREEVLDLAIAQQLEGLMIAPAVLELLRRAIREMHSEQKQAHTDRREALQREHSTTLDRLEKLYLDRIAGKVPDSLYDKLSAEWQTKAAALAEQLAAVDRASLSTWEDNVRMLEAVSNSASRFKSADSATKRAMAKNLLSNFSMTAGNVALELEPWFKMVANANIQTQENAPVGDVLETWWAQLDSN